MRIALQALLAVTLSFGGCAAFDTSEVQPIPGPEIASVIREAKRQISLYQASARDLKPGQKYGDDVDTWTNRRFSCGRGNIGYTISKVKLALTTEINSTYSLGLSASGAAAGIPITGSVKGSLEGENTQELKYTLYPLNLTDFSLHDMDRSKPAPIADALISLRDASIEAATESFPGAKDGDCFRNFKPGKDAGDDSNSYQLGLKVTKGQGADIGLGLAPIDLKLSVENKSVTGNTLTVTFAQSQKGRALAKKKVTFAQLTGAPSARGGRGCPLNDPDCEGVQHPAIDADRIARDPCPRGCDCRTDPTCRGVQKVPETTVKE